MKRIATLIGAALVASSVLTMTPGPAQAAVYRCNGKVATIVGTSGNDTLNGTMGNDVIIGLGGKDTINGRGGNDIICGGSGNDSIFGGAGSDRIYGGNGHDEIEGGSGADYIDGQAGNDRILGGAGNDTLYGRTGHDAIYAGSGNDRSYGGSQSDVIYAGPGTDRLWGQSGRDVLYGGPGSAVTYGGPSIDACYEAVEPDGSKCDKDQLNASWADNVEVSDLLSNQSDYSSYSFRPVAQNYPAVNGKTYRNGIGCREDDYMYDGYSCTITFILSRKYTRFAARLGHMDTNGAAGAKVRYELIGDGNVIASKTVSYGQSPSMIANVGNVLRLDLRITTLNDTPGDGYSHFLWLEPRIAARSGLKPANPVPVGT